MHLEFHPFVSKKKFRNPKAWEILWDFITKHEIDTTYEFISDMKRIDH